MQDDDRDGPMTFRDATAPEPLPPLPPNSCVLAVRPGPDKAHTLLRLVFDVTHLSDDAKKLLVFMVSEALTKLEESVRKMGKIETASKLAFRERTQHQEGNGQPPLT